MAHPKPDFTIKWGTLDEPIAPIADIDQNNGWSFLGNTPPTAAQFDYMMALYDKRDAWLEERAVKAPSETDTAMLEIATQAETDAGTDDVRAVTPRKLRFGFGVSLTSNGYIKFPSWLSGVIIQWGAKAVAGDSSATLTFPLAFPNAALQAVASQGSSFNTQADSGAGIYNITSSTATLINGSGSTSTIRWIAIGH